MSNTIPTIVTYHSTNNKPEWFAYLKPNGEFLGVRMEGSTEAEAIERARNWWINEKARQCRLTGAMELDDSEVGSKSYKDQPTDAWANTGNGWGTPGQADFNKGGWSSAVKGSSDHGMAGKVWMIHHDKRARLRADPGQVQALIGQGWEKAGPKTAFRE